SPPAPRSAGEPRPEAMDCSHRRGGHVAAVPAGHGLGDRRHRHAGGAGDRGRPRPDRPAVAGRRGGSSLGPADGGAAGAGPARGGEGGEVLELALRHLPEVFIVTPSGSLLAPNALEVLMNPDDFDSLTEVMDQSLIDSWACEAYQSCIGEHAARLGGDGPVMVRVASDPDVLAGRYRLRQGRLVGAAHAVSAAPAGAPHG